MADRNGGGVRRTDRNTDASKKIDRSHKATEEEREPLLSSSTDWVLACMLCTEEVAFAKKWSI